MTYGIKMART